MKNKIIRTVFKDRIEYTLNGYVHRTDGPARIYYDGAMFWYHNNKYHRADGPAIIWSRGIMQRFILGSFQPEKY